MLCGSDSVVECHLAKVKVAGPNPVSRSIDIIWHHSQVVRQGSAKSSSPVQVWVMPPKIPNVQTFGILLMDVFTLRLYNKTKSKFWICVEIKKKLATSLNIAENKITRSWPSIYFTNPSRCVIILLVLEWNKPTSTHNINWSITIYAGMAE